MFYRKRIFCSNLQVKKSMFLLHTVVFDVVYLTVSSLNKIKFLQVLVQKNLCLI